MSGSWRPIARSRPCWNGRAALASKKTAAPGDVLFLNGRGRPMTTRDVRRVVLRLGLAARRDLLDELEGVLAVLTGDDLPEKFGIMPSTQDEEALAYAAKAFGSLDAIFRLTEAQGERGWPRRQTGLLPEQLDRLHHPVVRDDAGALKQEPVVVEDLFLEQDLVHDLVRAADEQVLAQSE